MGVSFFFLSITQDSNSLHLTISKRIEKARQSKTETRRNIFKKYLEKNRKEFNRRRERYRAKKIPQLVKTRNVKGKNDQAVAAKNITIHRKEKRRKIKKTSSMNS